MTYESEKLSMLTSLLLFFQPQVEWPIKHHISTKELHLAFNFSGNSLTAPPCRPGYTAGQHSSYLDLPFSVLEVPDQVLDTRGKSPYLSVDLCLHSHKSSHNFSVTFACFNFTYYLVLNIVVVVNTIVVVFFGVVICSNFDSLLQGIFRTS